MLVHQLLLLYTTLTWRACLASEVSDGSGDDDGSGVIGGRIIDPGFCVKVLALTRRQFYIYWIRPDIDSNVSYYQVSYNVSVRYQTMSGERVFTDTHTTGPLSVDDDNTLKIPLYTTNSTYMIQVTAVTEDDQIIISDVYTLPENEFEDRMEQNDAIKFFQLGLELTDPHDTLQCSSFENIDGILSLIQSQLAEAIRYICTLNQSANMDCAVQLANNQLTCPNNTGLVYVARVVGTADISTTAFLEYLNMSAGSFKVSFHNHTFSVVSSHLCPLSIPSAQESNCIPQSDSMMNPATSGDDNSDIVVTTVIAISCSLGIIVMVFCIVCVMFVYGQCAGYHGDIESIDLESEEPYKVKTTVCHSQEDPTLTSHYPTYCTAAAKQLRLPGATPQGDPSLSSPHDSHHNRNVDVTQPYYNVTSL